MKKLICILVAMQLLIMFAHGLLIFRSHAISSLLNDNTSTLALLFDTAEEYCFFIEAVDRKGLTVTRNVFIDDTNLIIYTSDMTLNGRVVLRNGRWPAADTNEFVSTVNSGEANQVGLIYNVTPGFNLSISRIENTTSVDIHGMFSINSIDEEILLSLVYELSNNIYRAELFSINNEVSIWSGITLLQLVELAAISLLMFLCVLASILNYSASKLKSSSVLVIHGYSDFNVARILTLELLNILLVSLLVSYSLLVLYMTATGQLVFLSAVSLYFIAVYIILSLIYIITTNIVVFVFAHKMRISSIIKGKKPYFILQSFNHILKISFTISLLIFGSVAGDSFIELRQRMAVFSDWENAQNIHTVRIFYVGQFSDLSVDLEIIRRKTILYEHMSQHNNAFIMNARPVHHLDLGLEPYFDMSNFPPLKLSPHGYRVTISPNYLNINPIYASNGVNAKEQIVFDDYVLNLLVPESLRPYEDEIQRLYLKHFIHAKINVDNIYNENLGLDLNETPINDLSINIIYVLNNQYYFTFSTDIRPQYGNRIRDPIAVVYTGSVHPSYLSTTMTHSFFFHTNAIDAHSSILPLLVENGLSHVIRRTVSIFNQKGTVMIELRERYVRMMGYMAILLISSILIIYALMSNYFEKNKQSIFIKLVMGFGFIDRHFRFLCTVTAYSFIAMLLLAALLPGGYIVWYIVFLIGLPLLLLDAMFAFLIDKQLTKKSFSQIIKGGG